MNKRNLIRFAVLGSLLLTFAVLLPPGVWSTQQFDDIDSQSIHSGLGTLEFRVKLLRDISSDPHDHVLLLAVSSDAEEFYKVEIIEEKLIVWRQFGGCIRTAFSTPHQFKAGDWHELKLEWNKESTKLQIDGREVKKLGLYSTGDLPKMIPCIRLGHEENFKIDDFRASGESEIPVARADQEFVRNCVRPNFGALLAETSQEEYRGISLRHFPDRKSREKAKSYLALLPQGFAESVKNVVFVEDARFPRGGEAGIADADSWSVFLKGSYWDDPNVFFHEAAHLYDYRQKFNFGVSPEQSEWTAISGKSCYYSGGDMDEFAKRFEKIKIENGFLAGQGGQCPSEDLAIWTAAAYDYYIKNETFSDILNPSSAQYSEKNKKKIDFLVGKGLISRAIYNKVTSTK